MKYVKRIIKETKGPQDKEKVTALDDGADDYLTKPFSATELMARIRVAHVHLLRENVLQIRELYQSMQDARQNKIMAVITIVTTIFLLLTLITGWYGMNFVYMPELQWRYGYFAVIMISLIIVIAEIIYFKKKKFF